jgi:nucleoside-diphosphate-sugar epimerase
MTAGAPERTAILAGATGLVGGHLLRLLLADPRYGRVIALSRRGLGIEHAKLRSLITAFDAVETALPDAGETVDDAFCALGTTIRTAGSRAGSGAWISTTWLRWRASDDPARDLWGILGRLPACP